MGSSVVRQMLVGAGVYPSNATKRNELAALIQQLRPTATERPLVRVGPTRDGGYLLPDDLMGIKSCFSPGVSDCSDFEWDLAERGMNVFLADRSVAGPAVEHSRFHFIPKFLASRDAPNEGLITLDQWYRDCVGDPYEAGDDAILQMDIEGAEYEVIHSLSTALLNKFRILVIEFHRLHLLLNRDSFRWLSSTFHKLLSTHRVVHLHPNNATGTIRHGPLEIPLNMEFTWLRRDRLVESSRPLVYPHRLDAPNVRDEPELPLPACWRPSPRPQV